MGGWVLTMASQRFFFGLDFGNMPFSSGFKHVKKTEGSQKTTCQMDENFALQHVGCHSK
jgi:hypothetical protein